MADISKIKLPSGNEYDIKDAVAREMISGGISFIIAWTATDYASTSAPTAAKLATIPAGAEVAYNNGASTATGTLAASSDTKAKFYLLYSKTQAGNLDAYNEYVTVEDGSNFIWEKIGDTQIDLSNVVTDVTLSKQTDTAIGTDATFTITQPTITLTANASTASGRLKYVEDVTGGSISPTKVHLGATASGGAVSASGDNVTALTGLGSPSTSSVVTGVSTAKLATTTVTGVSGSTNITPVESRSSQTTVSGFTAATTSNYDSTNDILKGASVSNEVLILGAYKPDTQTTYSAGAPRASLAVPTAAANATTVATGGTTTSGSGATIATGSSGSVDAVTGYASPTTDTVLGTSSSFSVTNPTITVTTNGSTGPEVVGDVDDITVAPTYKYMSGSASGANTAWNSKDSVTVLTNATDVNVTKGGNA